QRLAELSGKTISIEDAAIRLRRIEEQKSAELVQQLSPIRDSAQATLQSIVNLATDLQNEEIEVEDQRFESAVENARNTVINSILKDANSSFPEIASYSDGIKFKDQLESLTNRLGQLTGSHSKLFNVFLKKYADKFRSEFADFTNLNKKASKLIKNYDVDLEDTNACSKKIGDLSNNLSSLNYSKERIATMSVDVKELEKDITQLTTRRREIEQSDEYKYYAHLESESKELEKSKAEFREYVSDLFSHLNRAFTKYSYGVSKSVSTKIDLLSNSPWEVFLNQGKIESDGLSNTSDQNMGRSKEDREMIDTYRTLLVEIRGAVTKGSISLKDSDKVSTYLDKAIDMFPKIESRGWEIQQKAMRIRQNQNRKAFNSIKSLDDLIQRNEGEIQEKKILIAETQATLEAKRKEITDLTNACSNLLTEIIGQEKIITTKPD
ncbi:MAG TPA: hypothetical protein VFG77_05055, partial [Nitrososphaeraceae archaeon]|nr:hypothetical protein [Nitrososphaeraceae archaeon]